MALLVSSPSGRMTTGETDAPPAWRTLPCASQVVTTQERGWPMTGGPLMLVLYARMVQCLAAASPGTTHTGRRQLGSVEPPTETCTE